MCQGVWEGFWPWANTHFGECPDILDLSLPEPENPDEAQFLHNQQGHLFTGHFSESFGDKLLPGMYCMPIFAVPKLQFYWLMNGNWPECRECFPQQHDPLWRHHQLPTWQSTTPRWIPHIHAQRFSWLPLHLIQIWHHRSLLAPPCAPILATEAN